MSALSRELDRIGREAAALIDDGDRAWYLVRAISAGFRLGQDKAVQVTFNVPADADFYGMSMNLYYQYRIIDPTNAANNDRAFRPCAWSNWANTVIFTTDSATPNPGHEGNGTVAIQDDAAGPYQNAPFSVTSMYSAPYGVPAGQEGPPVTLFPGALRFHRPYYIARGKAINLLYTSLFTSAFNLDLAENLTTEYRVVGILDGYKKVTAFQ